MLFFENISLENPAYVAIKDKNSISCSTYTISLPIMEANYSNSSGRISLNVPIKKLSSGFGFHTMYDKFGHFSYFNTGAIYSFKYDFDENYSLALGSDFSVNINKLRASRIDLISYDEPNIHNDIVNSYFNVDLGLWFKAHKLNFGITNKHLNHPKINNYYGSTTILSNINIILNYNFRIGNKIILKNNLLTFDVFHFSDYKQLMLNNQFEINNKFIIGLTSELYATSDKVVILASNIGLNLSDKFKFVMSVELFQISKMDIRRNVIEGILTYNF
ncbi:MAG: hypothetical protein A2046_01795 [Bacteroidetes bacterium GWA2_30_7]|nr:MAG: hypothetical protein A2046_01795 [Bacteroidetes bacterium GWA2_30_7]